MSGFLYNLGRQLGRKAVPAIRKSKLIWDGLAGTDEEALRAEAALRTTLAAELRAFAGPVDDPELATQGVVPPKLGILGAYGLDTPDDAG